MSARNSIECNRRLQSLVVKVLIHHVVDVNQDKPHHVLHVLAAHHLQPQTQRQQGDLIAAVSLHHFGCALAVQL